VDLVPYGGASSPIDHGRVHDLLSRDSSRLARYYDSVILIARPDNIVSGLAASLPSPEFLYCVQPGSTPLHQLREQLDAARAMGAVVRGIVIWDAERPDLAVEPPAKRPPIRPPAREPQPSTV
jgi:hypothetical protein